MQLHMQYVEKMYDEFGDTKETIPYPSSASSTLDHTKTSLYALFSSTSFNRPDYRTTCSDKSISLIGWFVEGEFGDEEIYEYSI